MEHVLTHGDISWMDEQKIARGQVLKENQTAPELRPDLLFYWDAFNDLSTCREVGMSVGPIPYLAILTFAKEEEIKGIEFEELKHVITSMDGVYLDHIAKDIQKGK